MVVGVYIIFLNVALIIYFSFREGLRGGYISAGSAILYYFYIVYTRHYTGQQYSSGIATIVMLAVLYFVIAGIIGSLKQEIDILIDREAEGKRRLESIIQQLPVGVLITDSHGKLIQSNKQIDKILGVTIPIGFNFNTYKSFLIDMNLNKSQISLLNQIKTGKTTLNKILSYERSDGTKLLLRISTTQIYNQAKKLIAAASIINDITQQKALERQKDDFLSMASHELKTPITSLKMFVELQRNQLAIKNSQKAKYFNDRIFDQANRLKELTNDLLDVSRIQTGKLHFIMEEFDISQVISDTVEGLKDTTKKHEIIFNDPKKQMVIGDRYRIYQVLDNLISNAIKYSPSNSKITVHATTEQGKVIISVQDNGIGICPDQQSKIFDRLYQVTDPDVKTYPGLGMGLYIAKEIVNGHHGDMWVQSSKGKGSMFFFSLPRCA